MTKPILQCLVALTIILMSCNPSDQLSQNPDSVLPIREGSWRISMNLPGAELPFNMKINFVDSAYEAYVVNDIEEIYINDFRLMGDSFFISMPVFQSNLTGIIESDSVLSGNWNNLAKGPDYHVPFKARHGIEKRFENTSEPSGSVAGKWEVTFSEDKEDPCKAIGLFKQSGNIVTGTFLTETGDFRFLEGVMDGDSIYLSCFDGSHAFLFKAGITEGELKGSFWSGNHWRETWTAMRNDSFELSDPDSLTYLKPGYERLSFAFPNEDSMIVSLSDSVFQNKVVIVQIMGSWCPNCADEIAFLTELHNLYHDQGLEIIALAYEKTSNFNDAFKAINKMKSHYGADYEFLLAGKANKKEAQKTLPMLNHIMSYPTCIFIDRQMNIQKIRTGFFGPGTGKIYEDYTSEIERFTRMMLKRSEV